jgi:hypothetical protein
MANAALNSVTSNSDTSSASTGAEAAAETPRIGAKEAVARRSAKTQPLDYDAPAELFSVRGSKVRRQAVGYRRFTRAADAIRFAIEQLSPAQLSGAYLEVDEMRFDSVEIRGLYDRGELASASQRRTTATRQQPPR